MSLKTIFPIALSLGIAELSCLAWQLGYRGQCKCESKMHVEKQ